MKTEYLKLFIEVIQYQEEDVIRTSSSGEYGADGEDDYGYDLWG